MVVEYFAVPTESHYMVGFLNIVAANQPEAGEDVVPQHSAQTHFVKQLQIIFNLDVFAVDFI
jgi:hypothetical protein